MDTIDFDKLYIGQKVFDIAFGEAVIIDIEKTTRFFEVKSIDYDNKIVYDHDGCIFSIQDHDDNEPYYICCSIRRTISFLNEEEVLSFDIYGKQPDKRFDKVLQRGDIVFIENKKYSDVSTRFVVLNEEKGYVEVCGIGECLDDMNKKIFYKNQYNIYKASII